MADYLSSAIMQARLGVSVVKQLTDDAGTGAVITAILDDAIASGEADFGACIYKGWQGPITVAVHGQRAFDMAVQLSFRMARYHLYSRRPHLMGDNGGWVFADYEAAMKTTSEMAKGLKALPGIPPPPRDSPESPAASSSNAENTTVPPRNWGRDNTGIA